jgi:UDP-N-acetylglucosamine--N-acetylmuramyl-(pentapeptide) pyrophosphoryl-undecaprenol N-acetylglucosamine transferase
MRYVFVCGGTAGHINPAVAVADVLKEKDPYSNILFIGSKRHMEEELVPKAGYPILLVDSTFFTRGFTSEDFRHNIHFAALLAKSTAQSCRILRHYHPDVVVGTGGYVCYPVLKAAKILHLPTAVHESNAIPGLTTALLAPEMDLVMVGIRDSLKHYKHSRRIEYTGTPVRGDFESYTKPEAKKLLGLQADKPLVVSTWGSLGADFINKILPDFISLAVKKDAFYLIHSTGKDYYTSTVDALRKKVPDYREHGIDIRDYIYDMGVVMAAADLVVGRSGASTIAELCYMGKPTIFIPSPNVTHNHQEKNARVLERIGGAQVLLQSETTPEILYKVVDELAEDAEKRKYMGEAMRGQSVRNAAHRIADLIMSLAKNKK